MWSSNEELHEWPEVRLFDWSHRERERVIDTCFAWELSKTHLGEIENEVGALNCERDRRAEPL